MSKNINLNEADSFKLNYRLSEAIDVHNDIKFNVDKAIEKEQQRQVAKFGLRDQSNGIWLAILGEEVGEVSTALLRIRFSGATHKVLIDELVQVAAVAKSWLENLAIVALPDFETLFTYSPNDKG